LVVVLLVVLGVLAVLFVPAFLDPNRLPASQWKEFLRRYVTPEGRVVDTGNGNISHSEGQSYGMLFAVAFNDRRSFERIWGWTQQYLQIRPDTLFAWKWEPNAAGGGGITDLNNASDGDLVIAWALWLASERWNHQPYAQLAAQILSDLRVECFRETEEGLFFLPAQKGFVFDDGEKLVLNPSYSVFPAFSSLAKFTLREEMERLTESGLLVCEGGRFSPYQLPGDWIVWNEGAFSLPTEGAFPAEYGYNAIRVPLFLAWGKVNEELLRPFVQFWDGLPEGQPMPAVVALPSGEFGTDPALPGMKAIAGLVRGVLAGEVPRPREVQKILPDEAYYSAALKLLTMLAARDLHSAEIPVSH
jgi:endoglucanase